MHGKKIVSNSAISVAYKITMLLLGFVTRKIFIIYLGEEILGLNSLYTNLLDLLNLAELGIGVAVQYQLYGPLVNNDNEKLSKILSSAKKLYNRIGFFVLTAGVVLSFFIQYLIKSTTYPIWFIRVAFLISVTGIAFSYFFVHKRLFLQANEEIGLVNIIDLIAKIVTVCLSLITTIIWKNYFLYLFINSLYGLTGNIIIYFIFKKKHPDIKENIKDTASETEELTKNLKNVVPMKLSNYIYNSTDNVVISKTLGLTTVALYSNYMTIINGLMGIEFLFGNIVTSAFGKIIREVEDKSIIYRYYLSFQYAQFLFTGFTTVSLAIICEPFIKLWIGERFVVGTFVFALLVIDFYVHSMYQPAYVMFGAAGKFKDDKYITLASAVMNIVISIIMVNIIGLPGVIVGTLVTDLYIWIVRTYQMVKKYFYQNLTKYTIRMFSYTFSVIVGFVLSFAICRLIHVNNLILELVLKLVVCLIVPNAVNILFTIKSNEFAFFKSYAVKFFRKGT